MAGTLKIELSGATKEELKRQLEDVIRELDKYYCVTNCYADVAELRCRSMGSVVSV